MKNGLLSAILTCLLIANSGLTARAEVSNELSAALGKVKSLHVVPNQKFQESYDKTQCFDVSVIGYSEKKGLFCESQNPQFIQDMGISKFDTLPDAARPRVRPVSGLVVSTPMSQYGMSPMPGTQGRVFETTVDCDTELVRSTELRHRAISL